MGKTGGAEPPSSAPTEPPILPDCPEVQLAREAFVPALASLSPTWTPASAVHEPRPRLTCSAGSQGLPPSRGYPLARVQSPPAASTHSNHTDPPNPSSLEGSPHPEWQGFSPHEMGKPRPGGTQGHADRTADLLGEGGGSHCLLPWAGPGELLALSARERWASVYFSLCQNGPVSVTAEQIYISSSTDRPHTARGFHETRPSRGFGPINKLKPL